MNNFIELTDDEWVKKFQPIQNHIDHDSSFNGQMFETYGAEVDFVREADVHNIWTYGDGDDGGTYIWNGFSIVNRIGYFITKRPWIDGKEYQVLISEPSFECDECVATHTSFDELIYDEENDSYLCAGCAPLDLLNQ